MRPAVAIVGMACIYPDANSPSELWENVLAQRRAFRRIPPERLRLEDYFSTDHSVPDRMYISEAALIRGYEFDRIRFRVSGNTYRSTDLTHWLALDTAARALADAGYEDGRGLPLEKTGVILGNTLTGEFSRANVMRLRWPYVRRVVDTSLADLGWSPDERKQYLAQLETRYKGPFPIVSEETLAGALSNTIAGRICNHFNLKGGGYTVDGACAASLLSVISACSSLLTEDLDFAIAGGVDLSVDPFELVGFAKAEALAQDGMLVYDTHSSGFWPGEGCGMVVLMREADARAQKRRIYATISGWGISSDGRGGITRPELEGQILALERAYRRAGIHPGSVAYFEGHGTGTVVGDATELQTLSRFRREADPNAPPAAIGAIKANIGHTKAAAGVAGLIKATLALHYQILPPTTGCNTPHPALTGEAPALRVLRTGVPWPADLPLYAGVSAMGFGGINTHIVLEGLEERRTGLEKRERILLASHQDAEIFLLAAADLPTLAEEAGRVSEIAPRLSRAELSDLASELAKSLPSQGARAAVVASSPKDLENRLKTLQNWLEEGEICRLDLAQEVFLGSGQNQPRIGFLFPGQGSPCYQNGGALSQQFESVKALYLNANLPSREVSFATDFAQPAIITASLAALRVLERLGITGALAIGHSLGELTAIHWAGAIDEISLLQIAAARGRSMAEMGSPMGAMASIQADPKTVAGFIDGDELSIGCFNSPRQTIISGERNAIEMAISRFQKAGLRAVILPVSHAFHSPLVAAVVPALEKHLETKQFQPLQRRVISTVTGTELSSEEDLHSLLLTQVTKPVLFYDAARAVEGEVDLWLEVGPGRVLTGLMAEFDCKPVIPLDAGGPSSRGLLQAIAAVFALGGEVLPEAIFSDRFTRPFDLNQPPLFFVNPCEAAWLADSLQSEGPPDLAFETGTDHLLGSTPSSQRLPTGRTTENVFDLVCHLVSQRAELPVSLVRQKDRLLSDLHLNSITVSQLIVEAAHRLGMPPPVALTDYTNATVEQVAQSLDELVRRGGPLQPEQNLQPKGVDTWVRAFTVELVEQSMPRGRGSLGSGDWNIIAPADLPFADRLREAIMRISSAGDAVILCLPPDPDERHLSLLIEAARAVLDRRQGGRLVLVQQGRGAASLARTLHLEAPWVITCVVDVPLNHPQAPEWVIQETLAAQGYTEAHYDASGKRYKPVLRQLPIEGEPMGIQLGPEDVLLVTGGGRGITAECAFMLARETGVRLALFGRSRPEEDAELAANLHRMMFAGVSFRYFAVDITELTAVETAIQEVENALGPVTGILHGAARNIPKLLISLEETDFLLTMRPKLHGIQNILAALNPNQLRLLIAFGSIIAHTGLPGEADYGLANEWLVRWVERFHEKYTSCCCLAIEWSVWSGVGMGERLSRVDALSKQGITPISLDEGINMLRQLLSHSLPVVPVIVAGRLGEPPTLQVEQPSLPFLRFLEQPRVHYPSIELIVDAQLSPDADPYLEDHIFRGERLFPAVMGLEAMAQIAMALSGETRAPTFEEVKFIRPVVVPEKRPETIRLAALIRQPGLVEVVLRCESTAFQMDHFQAICRFSNREPHEVLSTQISANEELPALGIIPHRDLYAGLLFQSGRFRRLQEYYKLKATECIAEIGEGGMENWFGPYMPSDLVLDDPGRRDTALHAIQACIPHSVVLPIGVDHFAIRQPMAKGSYRAHAQEILREGDIFTFNVDVFGPDGQIQEQWDGLQMKRVETLPLDSPWAGPLLGAYLERRLSELLPTSSLAVVVEQGAVDGRRSRSDRAIQRALGIPMTVYRRPDGKPEAGPGSSVSVAHADTVTMAIAGKEPLGCDIEPVVARQPAVWAGMLGEEGFNLVELTSRETREDLDLSATRVWSAGECLRKAGRIPSGSFVYFTSTQDGWVLFTCGPLLIATVKAAITGLSNPLIFAVLCQKDAAHEFGLRKGYDNERYVLERSRRT